MHILQVVSIYLNYIETLLYIYTYTTGSLYMTNNVEDIVVFLGLNELFLIIHVCVSPVKIRKSF